MLLGKGLKLYHLNKHKVFFPNESNTTIVEWGFPNGLNKKSFAGEIIGICLNSKFYSLCFEAASTSSCWHKTPPG